MIINKDNNEINKDMAAKSPDGWGSLAACRGTPTGTSSGLCSPTTSYNVDSKSCSVLKQVSAAHDGGMRGDVAVGHPEAVPRAGAVGGGQVPLGGL